MSEPMVGVAEKRRRLPLVPSQFRKKLIQEVQRKLRKAVDAQSNQRGDLLQQLFTDVALEVDSEAQALLTSDSDAPSGSVEETRDRPLCFYEVLAEHYAQIPEDGKEVLALFVKLWSQSLAAQIFTLLFYEWLFEIPKEDLDGYLRYSTAFVEGASTIFWIDLESNTQRFFSLFHYTLNEVIMNPQGHSMVPIQARRQLILTLSRFFFLYEPATELEEFFNHFPSFPAQLDSADIFVVEVVDQLQTVKVEPVLLHYLKCAKVLKGMKLQVSTSTRLRTALYVLTSPGGPMYPTRLVRHAAWETLDCLFPVGRHSRHLISLFFRLMHPYYWPVSFSNYVVNFLLNSVDRICIFALIIWNFFTYLFEGPVQGVYLFLLSIRNRVIGGHRH